MSKKLMLVIAGIVVAGGLVGFLVLNKDDSKSSTQNNSSGTSKTEEKSKTSGSLSSLSSGGKAQECDFSSTSPAGTASGKMYSDGKGRGLMEIDLVSDKGNIGKSHTLVTSDKAYSWTETGGQTFGLVFDKAQLESANSTAATTGQTSASNTKQNFDMECKAWFVDEAKLTVPTGINFQALPQPSV